MEENNKLKRIYHSWDKWEDYKFNFYDNCTGKAKPPKIEKVLEMFNNEELTELFMRRIINEWYYSCEHNLTNYSSNRIAWLGQAACALYANVPNMVTMEAWNLLSTEVQERSNNIAEKIINEWENKHIIENKNA